MQTHADILDQREALGKPLLASVGFHALIFGVVAFYSLGGFGKTEQWGDQNPFAGGAVAITPVSSINLPSKNAPVNPVANDTESQIPSPPKVQPKKAEPKPDPNAVKLKSKADIKKLAEQFERQHKFTSKDARPNQVYSTAGQQMSSPMFQTKSGSGAVGSAPGNPFGNRFGWYEQLLREKVARNWRSQDVDAHQTTNSVVVTFVLQRDGSIRDAKIAQASGYYALDQSALRAIMVSSPFPPLPPQYEKDSANLEFRFHLER